jgi:hypothetical protein
MISRYNDVVPRDLQVNLARIGSFEYQQKYCINATVSEYVLLDDLLDTTMYAVEHYLARSTQVSHTDRMALHQFIATANTQIDGIPWRDQDYSIQQIVYCDAMKEVREAATKCLQDLGASLSLEEF